MAEKTRKEQLIEDIEKLLNTYNGVRPTSINPALLQFMDEDTLVSIIDSLLDQKEENANPDEEWLEKFKTK
ncbi:MAG: hypothetical protein ABGW85_04905 [Sulfurimonas sp.]